MGWLTGKKTPLSITLLEPPHSTMLIYHMKQIARGREQLSVNLQEGPPHPHPACKKVKWCCFQMRKEEVKALSQGNAEHVH